MRIPIYVASQSFIQRVIGLPLSVCVLCGPPVWPFPPVVGPLWGPPLCVGPLCWSPVRVPCVGPLCGSPLYGSPVWVPCVGPSSRCVHVASTRVMSPARTHAPAQPRTMKHSPKTGVCANSTLQVSRPPNREACWAECVRNTPLDTQHTASRYINMYANELLVYIYVNTLPCGRCWVG